MLEMVPLGTDEDAAEASGDPSATQFFAIPAPKAERARPAPPPQPMGGGGAYGGPPPGGPPPMGQPAPAAMPGPIGYGGVAQQGASPMIQGPVAHGQTMQGGSPFQVQGGGPMSTPDAGSRVQSNRVYAIIFAVFLLVAVALFVAVWFRFAFMAEKEPEPVAMANPVVGAGPVHKAKAAPIDTGIADKPVAKATPKHSSGSGHSSSGSSGAGSAPKPPPASAGPLTVKLADPTQATSIEVTCNSGLRTRAGFSGGSATVQNVPNDSCTIHFKGGAPAKFSPVHGNMSVTCTISQSTAVCK